MITTKNLTLQLKHKTVLNNVSITLPQGAITAFIGQSGAGKTSLLKCLANLYRYHGDVLYQGNPLKKLTVQQRVHAVGFVFQQFHLFNHMSVLHNCVQPQVVALKIPWQRAEKKALAVLDSLGLLAHAQAYPHQLSGGQQQRVAIARALVLEPKVLLFDEPSSALDPQATKQLAQLLKDLNKKGVTVGLCSHDVAFIKDLSDCVYLVDGGKVVDEYHVVKGILLAESPIGNFLGKQVE